MFLEMTETMASAQQCYRRGTVYDVDDVEAAHWVAAGVARSTSDLPHGWRRVFDRLQIGAGRPCLFPPMLGEFGHLMMSHVPMVHHHAGSRKVVACRAGEEVLFPSADECVAVEDAIADKWRCGTLRNSQPLWLELQERYPEHVVVPVGELTLEEELVAIHPQIRVPFRPRRRGLAADVVLGIRHREFCPEKNWAHWQDLADAIGRAGYTFAVAGALATSLELKGQKHHSGDYYDTDAAIELLQNCRLFVGSDTGGAHLAAAVGAPMLVFREHSPGNRDLRGRMELVNAGRVEAMPDRAWDEPASVIARALARLEASDAGSS